MAVDAERIRQRQRDLPTGRVRRRGGATERRLRRRRIEQIAFQIRHRGSGDQSLVDIGFAEA